MADNGQEIPVVQAASVTVQCQECGGDMEVYRPNPYLINHTNVSMICVPHENLIVCAQCGSIYTHVITPDSNVETSIKCIHKAEPLIVPANSLTGFSVKPN